MNKFISIILLAAIATVVLADAKKDEKFFFRPRPWIPINIPIPRPPACPPALAGGCQTCGATGVCTTPGTCWNPTVTCPASCTCTPPCEAPNAAGCP